MIRVRIHAFLRQPVVWVIIGAVLVGVLVISALVFLRPRPPVSVEIMKQLNFSLLYPDGTNAFQVDEGTVSFDKQSKVLVYHAKTDGNDLVISEQATPDPFYDIPEYYPKLIEKLHGYSDFESLNGKVSLTRPEELKGGQSAVFNGKGTLMFVHPEHDLSNEDWRKFFNALVIEK